MRAWIALFSAIACEVTGTLALKLFGLQTPWLAVAVTGSLIVLSYLLLSLAFRRIPVAVAFAVWEAVGLAAVTLLGVWLLGDHLTKLQLLALGGLLLGAWLLHGGTRARSEA
ncbi:QacE family quaternary ammonium compound efflux SMR transporter [Deinococcus metallilatus]|uniref:Spermidine export protein MdtJ n=1 Tax=Deinococcus metallilatus TaxID=1211322 RepID=A0AAJ5F504_9DEIO|nr:SMR family transporter [Deinococcus metallilatus]MBB5295546.1 multidrug transporter EmrE-like cation transporter [Deinococcus metallilatus]QBY07940.1 QacE family quaternary ammonium compound efflux SMR transporter [Deinococcus metallilatus]RXJ12833.1 QacE family quaternary ammonium compound efflux SMR transporter [Deinococcus metallilatus]TLK27245.1 QacE family quaternary ammonium compound efflux SMR transporter [Deinococcus metallilatus]GMA16224.1 multidrug transporter subunit MdtJ [Deinoc